MPLIDLSKATVQVDENFVDKEGNPKKEAAIFEDNVIVCHPEMKEKVETAINLFFKGGLDGNNEHSNHDLSNQ